MGEANEGGRSKLGGMENLSLEKYRPRDLLQRLMCSSSSNTTTQQQAAQNAASFDIDLEEEEDAEEEVELNLGLSLGGRFGVDKNANKNKLIRSSSIVGTMPLVRNRNDNGDEETTTFFPPVSSYPNLIRTSSLPTETEEEWRKRKELQTLRRMAAKRRRSEKQRNSAKAEKEDEVRRGDNTDTNTTTTTTFNLVGSPSGLPTWAAAARQALLAGTGADVAMAKSKQNTSQGSVESQGGSSSGMSEMESKLIQGSSSCGEARSPAGHQSSQEGSQENMGPLGMKTPENKCATSGSKMESPSKSPNAGGNKGREIGMNAMEDMPCVFTKGDGPNGRRIDGILYRYGKGEEVRIMCVCHGKFLSPAEFVKHAGGGDVAHPLRHIVINPSSTSFLS